MHEDVLSPQRPPSQNDPTLLSFRKRVEREPEQVVRYDLEGEPLWIGEPRPGATDIPVCEHCGRQRVFECQLMPQLLNSLEVFILFS